MQHQPIPLSAIAWGRHVKRDVQIDSLADSIKLKGCILPIVLSPLPDGTFLLNEGGRRLQAGESLGITEVHHAATARPGVVGYVLTDSPSSEFDSTMTELIGNLHREDPDWREQCRLLYTGYKIAKREAVLASEELTYATFGKMMGNFGHSDVNCAVNIYEDLVANPEKYKDCNSFKQAYAKKLDDAKKYVADLMAKRMMKPSVPAIIQPEREGEVIVYDQAEAQKVKPVVNLSKHFVCIDSLKLMEAMEPAQFDHVVCDPDFAIEEERLAVGSSKAGEGIAQSSVEESLHVLERTMSLAYLITRPRAFFIFWMDQEHREKCERMALAAGWLVQRWMFIWHKNDYRSNNAVMNNFTKDYETALICRKQGTTLAQYPQSSIFSFPSGATAKEFSHPFAKPPSVWKRLFQAIALPGESVYDPFLGSGSSAIGAIRSGLRANGSEINQDHFNNALLNLKKEYNSTLGEVVFE